MADRIQLRRDTSANWSLVNPILAQGEPGVETDTGMQKIGDGTTAWAGLPYLGTGTTGIEFGGVAWDATHQYQIGDIISYNGKIYVVGEDPTSPGNPPPLGSRPGDPSWPDTPIDEEIGGVGYDATVEYKLGDIVADETVVPHLVYISLRDNNTGNPLIDMNWWQELDSIFYNVGVYTPVAGNEYPNTAGETAGAIWYVSGLGINPTTGEKNKYTLTTGPLAGYQVQDNDKIIWVAGSSPNEQWLWSPFPRIKAEVGGVAWSSGKEYEVGDIVGYSTSAYISISGDALNPNIGNPPTTSPGDWVKVSSNANEIGGVGYDAATTYSIGDVVSDKTQIPHVVYISLQNGNTGNSLFDMAWWQELDSIFYNVGTYTPVAGNEYPNTTGETAGAIWYVSGLGIDPATGEKNRYTFTTGPLTGYDVQDNDKVIWVAGATPNEQWMWSPYPRLRAEVGGIAWTSGKEYVIGDITTEGSDVYVAITGTDLAPNIGNQPSTNPADWAKVNGAAGAEKGGIQWNATYTYDTGDVVSEGQYLYIALNTNAGEQPSAFPGTWHKVEANEHGGVAYDPAYEYKIGDIVSDDTVVPHIVYISLQNSNIGNSLTDTLWWQELDSIFYNSAAVFYTPNATQEYPDTTGEIVGAIWYVTGLGVDANGDKIPYTITAGPLTGANVVDDDKLIWVRGASGSEEWLWSPYPRIRGEIGGILWTSGRDYITGDIVSFADATYVSLVGTPLAPNVGNQPDVSPAEWRLVGPKDVISRQLNPGNPGNPSPDTFPLDSNRLYVVQTDGVALPKDEVAYNMELPATPVDETIISLMDGAGNAQNQPVLILRNGATIDGQTDDLTCDVNWFDIKLIYHLATNNWSLGGK